jgi:hypothetical protein
LHVTWKPDVLDQHSEHVREVYAHFGLAVYAAQVLEHGLVNFVVVSRTVGAAFADLDARDGFETELFRATMGRQLRHALAEAPIADADVELLQAALRTRNFLVHAYFRERAADMLSMNGRNRMLVELDRMRDELGAADASLGAVTLALMGQAGLTRDMLEAELARMKSAIVNPDPDL